MLFSTSIRKVTQAETQSCSSALGQVALLAFGRSLLPVTLTFLEGRFGQEPGRDAARE
jgi:hypothetical protein